jgi:tRNA-uridine 2-sulfurtransferase
MAHSLDTVRGKKVVLGLSGGVDSAVAAIRLIEAGAEVEALHMTNWNDADVYCSAAEDLQDARRICQLLGITLHHVNFSASYRERVFAYFLDEYRHGRTPNPDVLCNREIKFGEFRNYARRLGGNVIATGHYARTAAIDGATALLKGTDPGKDQSYFLHAVSADALEQVLFPLGALHKNEVRRLAHAHGLPVHDKKDSTGICFIGERPFREFLAGFLPAQPGPIRTPAGVEVGRHAGLMYYTLGQRRGLKVGGRADAAEAAWYVVGKNLEDNTLVVDQGNSALLSSDRLTASSVHWLNGPPADLRTGCRLAAKVRYRQADQACSVHLSGVGGVEVRFDAVQRAVAPGQFVVFYDGDRCLGGAAIDRAWLAGEAAPQASSAANC